MSRVGILGGCFNPVHMGHLAMAQVAKEKIKLKEVIFVPTNLPPHKKIRNLAPAIHRYRMVKLAIKDNPSLKILDFEVKKPGKSYSIDTLRYLVGKYPKNTKFFIIIGRDLLPGLREWKDVSEIIKIASFVAIDRPHCKNKKSRIKHQEISMPEMDVSSSFLRRQIAKGKSVKYLVPDRVFEYIKKHKLYKK